MSDEDQSLLDVMHRAADDEMRRLGGCSLRHAIRIGPQAAADEGYGFTYEGEETA